MPAVTYPVCDDVMLAVDQFCVSRRTHAKSSVSERAFQIQARAYEKEKRSRKRPSPRPIRKCSLYRQLHNQHAINVSELRSAEMGNR